MAEGLSVGLRSSGASLITYFLGQTPRSVALIDVWARHLTPDLPTRKATALFAKCVNNTWGGKAQLEHFLPQYRQPASDLSDIDLQVFRAFGIKP